MTEDSLLAVRRDNIRIMKETLKHLKTQYELRFQEWLDKRGEYVTDTRVAFWKFRKLAEEYKELRLKLKGL